MEAGALVYRERGVAIDDETLEAAGAADAVLLGAMGLPEVRYPDGREISPQVDLRELWGLFAGVRPISAIDGAPRPLADARAAGIDFVLVREPNEGLFAARGTSRQEEREVGEEWVRRGKSRCERGH